MYSDICSKYLSSGLKLCPNFSLFCPNSRRRYRQEILKLIQQAFACLLCTKCIICIVSYNSLKNSWGMCFYYIHLSDEKTETQNSSLPVTQPVRDCARIWKWAVLTAESDFIYLLVHSFIQQIFNNSRLCFRLVSRDIAVMLKALPSRSLCSVNHFSMKPSCILVIL